MKKYAIITGASRGLGKNLAIRLSTHTDLTILITGRDILGLVETQKACSQKIEIVQADVGTIEGRNAIVAAISPNEKVAYLINNVGVIAACELMDLPLDSWRQQLAVNVEGPIFLSQQLLPYFTQNSRILNISSGFAHSPAHGVGVYCITKAALHMAYKCFSLELKNKNIFFGSLRPGLVDTRMQEEIRNFPVATFPELKKFQSFQAEGKLRSPIEVAQFIEWVLFNTKNNEFSDQEWDINDKTHHENWLAKQK